MSQDLPRVQDRSSEPHNRSPETYVYEPAGIHEQSGHIPAWLKLVTGGLIAWGIYYTIRFWSSD